MDKIPLSFEIYIVELNFFEDNIGLICYVEAFQLNKKNTNFGDRL